MKERLDALNDWEFKSLIYFSLGFSEVGWDKVPALGPFIANDTGLPS